MKNNELKLIFIDYLNIISIPKMTKKQKEKMRKLFEELQELCKGRKVLIIDSECIDRGHIGFKEI